MAEIAHVGHLFHPERMDCRKAHADFNLFTFLSSTLHTTDQSNASQTHQMKSFDKFRFLGLTPLLSEAGSTKVVMENGSLFLNCFPADCGDQWHLGTAEGLEDPVPLPALEGEDGSRFHKARGPPDLKTPETLLKRCLPGPGGPNKQNQALYSCDPGISLSLSLF